MPLHKLYKKLPEASGSSFYVLSLIKKSWTFLVISVIYLRQGSAMIEKFTQRRIQRFDIEVIANRLLTNIIQQASPTPQNIHMPSLYTSRGLEIW